MLSARKKHRVYRNALAFVLISVFSLSTIFSPLVKAEALPSYAWKDIVIPNGHFSESKISPDGSKLFVLQAVPGSSSKRQLIVSEDDGVSWNTFVAPDRAYGLVVSADGSKLIIRGKYGENSIYVSTDGGRNWIKAASPVSNSDNLFMSPDGAILAKYVYATEDLFVSNNDGQTWIQKGKEEPSAIFNGGKMVMQINDLDDWDLVKYLKWSTDYGETWSSVSVNGNGYQLSFSDDGNYVFESTQFLTSTDGGRSWSSLPSPLDSQPGFRMYEYTQAGISNDGKRLFIAPLQGHGEMDIYWPIYTSADGGNTWQLWGDGEENFGGNVSMSSDGSKILAVDDPSVRRSRARSYYRLATLPTPPPVTPGGTGSGTSGAVTPSTGSSSSGASTTAASSSTSNKKPGKSSSILAETGNSIWLVSGLAIIAVVAGGLALRKRP